ncbi:MAG: hypothetical protein WCE53_18325 [Candidatus Acidiferrum sp.]
MSDSYWITIAASLLGGGAAGAIITAIVNAVKNRKQTIAFRIEIVPLFKGGMLTNSDITATLTLSAPLTGGGYAQNVPNLSVANIEVVNRGNADYGEFRMGLTLCEGDTALHCTVNPVDRHHHAQIKTQLGPGAPSGEIDFLLVPFNRQDQYKFTVYAVAREGAEMPGKIELGSPEPVTFDEAPTATETLVESAKVALAIGPLKISIR